MDKIANFLSSLVRSAGPSLLSDVLSSAVAPRIARHTSEFMSPLADTFIYSGDKAVTNSLAKKQEWALKNTDKLMGSITGKLDAGINAAVKRHTINSQISKLTADSPYVQNYNKVNIMNNLGYTTGDAKNLLDMDIKGLEFNKLNLEIQKTQNDLARQNTVLGRLGRSSVGQFMGPMAAGIAATAGGVAAMKLGDAAGSLGLPNPLTDFVAEQNIGKIIEIEPSLAHVDRKRLLDYYKILYNNGSKIMKDPYLAAKALRNMIDFGGPSPEMVGNLADAERKMRGRFDSINSYSQMGNNILNYAR